jgi:hypothetical protein
MTTPLEFDFIKKGDLDALTAALDAGTDPNATDAIASRLRNKIPQKNGSRKYHKGSMDRIARKAWARSPPSQRVCIHENALAAN